MPTPLFDAVKKYALQNLVRFHTPGHSGVADVLKPFANVLPFDVTEVNGLDCLYHANGVILEAEKLAADFFGATRTLFSAGGCTLAIQTMLALVAPFGGKIMMARNCHVSVINALALLRVTPVFVYPSDEMDGRIDPKDIELALCEHTDVKAVFITSPNYYGVISDIPRIAELCKPKNIPLLVDNAHGSHLAFFEMHPLTLGASMTACSAHKTLPTLTGGAWLHINDERFVGKAKQTMALFGSTSPSYLIMSSLDLCRDWCEREGKRAFLQLAEKVREVKDFAESIGIASIDGNVDPVRITFNIERFRDVAETFRAHGVECEFCDNKYIVFIATPFHTDEDFEKLKGALSCLKETAIPNPLLIQEKPEQVMPILEALFLENEEILAVNAVFRISAETVCVYPPGIPIVMPGEKITDGIIETINNSGIFTIKVVK